MAHYAAKPKIQANRPRKVRDRVDPSVLDRLIRILLELKDSDGNLCDSIFGLQSEKRTDK